MTLSSKIFVQIVILGVKTWNSKFEIYQFFLNCLKNVQFLRNCSHKNGFVNWSIFISLCSIIQGGFILSGSKVNMPLFTYVILSPKESHILIASGTPLVMSSFHCANAATHSGVLKNYQNWLVLLQNFINAKEQNFKISFKFCVNFVSLKENIYFLNQ